MSRFVGKMLQEEMCRTDSYWEAYRQWKLLMESAQVGGHSAANRGSRDEAHERRSETAPGEPSTSRYLFGL
jgi:hypothetical protein